MRRNFLFQLRHSDSRIVKGLLMLFMLTTLYATLMAQPNPDAMTQISRSSASGTARTVGASGAFSSVGADLGGMELNPAGLGLYRSSDICITPGLRISADQSSYGGNTMSGNHTILMLSQAGAAFTKNYSSRTGTNPRPYSLRSITFGINFETQGSFDRDQNFSATNTNHSLIDNYVSVANRDYPASDINLFSYAGIIGTTSGGTYTSNVRAPVQQIGSIGTRGSNYKITLGLGANIGDKLFLGLSLAIPVLDYSINTRVYEGYVGTGGTDSITHFQNYLLSSYVSESGVGVTGKIGLIYKPAPWVRFGVAYSLPTWYFLSENYSGDLLYSFDTISNEVSGSFSAPLGYTLRTPMKGTIGASFFLKEHGFISIDYEFQNLGSTHYSFTDQGYSVLNSFYNGYMKNTYGYSHTVKIGLEGAIKKLRLRAGYSYTNSPFVNSQAYTTSGYNGAIQTATVGIGGRFKRFYIDAAYIFSYTKYGLLYYFPSSQAPLDQMSSQYITHNIVLTLGFKLSKENSTNSTAPKSKRRSNGELPKYIDPGDKY